MAVGKTQSLLTDGSPAVKAACLQALSEGVHSADVILNILARQRDPEPTATIMISEALRLRYAPIADCARYEHSESRAQAKRNPEFRQT